MNLGLPRQFDWAITSEEFVINIHFWRYAMLATLITSIGAGPATTQSPWVWGDAVHGCKIGVLDSELSFAKGKKIDVEAIVVNEGNNAIGCTKELGESGPTMLISATQGGAKVGAAQPTTEQLLGSTTGMEIERSSKVEWSVELDHDLDLSKPGKYKVKLSLEFYEDAAAPDHKPAKLTAYSKDFIVIVTEK